MFYFFPHIYLLSNDLVSWYYIFEWVVKYLDSCPSDMWQMLSLCVPSEEWDQAMFHILKVCLSFPVNCQFTASGHVYTAFCLSLTSGAFSILQILTLWPWCTSQILSTGSHLSFYSGHELLCYVNVSHFHSVSCIVFIFPTITRISGLREVLTVPSCRGISPGFPLIPAWLHFSFYT